jgi:putative endonuclease
MRFGVRDLGVAGERRAVWHYRLRGYTIVERNYRCPRGEIDLVVRRGRTTAFVEVKTRQQSHAGEPGEAVDAAKQLRIVRSAEYFLACSREEIGNVRFDVVSLLWTGWRFRLMRYADAFRPTADPRKPWRWTTARD